MQGEELRPMPNEELRKARDVYFKTCVLLPMPGFRVCCTAGRLRR